MSEMSTALRAARDIMLDVTPLRTDCGALCGAACCRGDGDDARGMMLFPGEDSLYAGADFARVEPLETPDADGHPISGAKLLVCDGHCPREMRPLCCMLFPLAPRLKDGEYRLSVDRRAFALCPLARIGAKGFSQDFIDAARRAFALLAQDEECRVYIDAWSALMERLRSVF